MRLHKLQMQAFGAYADRQEVDFQKLTDCGLFLLEGPTGSGKSTILDAITFALYSGLAGNGAGKDRLHSDYAKPDVHPYVELEFSVRGRHWRVHRMPDHERPKKRGTGTMLERGSVHLERLDGGQWISVSTNANEVGELLTEELGLTKDQFTQVVLLPQGEFATFLQAKDQDRRQVLTRIFGTALYDTITTTLEAQRRELNREVAERTQQVRQAIAVAFEAAGVDDEARLDELMEGTLDQRAEHLARVGSSLEQDLRQARSLEVAAHEAHMNRQKSRDEMELLVKRMGEFREATAALEKHESSRDEIDLLDFELRQGEAAAPLRPLLRQLGEAEAESESAQEAVLAHPEQALGRVVDLGVEKSELEARSLESKAASFDHHAKVEAGLADRVADLEDRASSLAAARERFEGLASECAGLPGRVGEAARTLAEAETVASRLTQTRDRVHSLTRRRTAAEEAAAMGPRVAVAKKQAAQADQSRIEATDQHQHLLQRRLDGMAAELAGSLQAGDSCPVCGAIEHPLLAVPDAGVVSEAAVERAAQERQRAEVAATTAREAAEQLQRQQSQHLVQAGGETIEDLSAQVESEKAALTECERAHASLDELKRAHADLLEKHARAAAELEAEQTALANAEAELEACRTQVEKDQEAVEEARGGHNSVIQRQDSLRTDAELLRSIVADVRVRDAAKDRATKIRAEATSDAVAAGFVELDDAREAVRDAAALRELKRRVQAWRETLVRLRTEVRREDFAGLDLADAEKAKEDHRTAQAAWKDSQGKWREAHDRTEALALRLARFVERQGKVGSAEKDLARISERAAPVTRLAGLCNGTQGHRKMALTTYVLRQWFVRVVEAANLRLDRMSSGRYALEHVEHGERKNDQVGLGLAVVDRYTGKSRSPKSMSGGETFYTSLALALGLADVVRAEAGGVELDTMFIDEGFGSLDADKLEDVIGVLDELREGNRTVGIVSHVTELKERIAERIEVRRTDEAGPSTLRVVA